MRSVVRCDPLSPSGSMIVFSCEVSAAVRSSHVIRRRSEHEPPLLPPPPRAVLLRRYIVQICGSFMIINGTIHMCAATATRVTPVEADIPPQTLGHAQHR